MAYRREYRVMDIGVHGHDARAAAFPYARQIGFGRAGVFLEGREDYRAPAVQAGFSRLGAGPFSAAISR